MSGTASSALRRFAPPLLILSGLGLIAAVAAVEYLVPGTQTLAQYRLSGTAFGLAAKLGGALFFGGLFALAVANAPIKPSVLPSGPDVVSPAVSAAAMRAARMVRKQRDQASA